MNEVLDIIYTLQDGSQLRNTIKISSIPTSVMDSKEDFENFLNLLFESFCSFREVKEDSVTILLLVKISTCFYSKQIMPKWFDDGFDGKFYYDNFPLED